MAKNVHFPFDLIITEGDDRTVTMTFTDASGDPQDISGWDFFYTAKSAVSDDDASAVVSLDPVDFTKSDSGTGTTDTVEFKIQLAPNSVSPGTYEQDIQTKDASGNITTIGRGQLVVEAQVTQREA